ncbi:MAG: acyl-CoA dehydratase activase [Thermodesulfobacteriota bacterium]|nr:acyl-CoA dehydratase activase [Thermodesulfobacteriota bacterium]
MITAGIDVGAKNLKVVLLKDNNVIGKSTVLMEMDRKKSINEGLDACLADAGIRKEDVDYFVATGAGEKSVNFAQKGITTVTCDAKGVTALNPSVRTVIDIGANEARAIKCDGAGKVTDFAVNEKCAAGSGAFVEAMARAMEVPLEEFVELSLKSEKSTPINAQCAIFAESEVVSLVHEETDRNDICRAVHDAMAGRIASMAKRVRIEEAVAVIGGVAYNKGMLASLKRELNVDFFIADDPEYVGAFGAALLGAEMVNQN